MKNEGKVLVCYRAVSTPSGGAASVRGAGKLPSYPISLERIVATENIAVAWQKVKSNKGAPGFDGVTIEDFPYQFRECWQEIRAAILEGNYTPNCCSILTCCANATVRICRQARMECFW
ncbi:MAG: hypothetical protein HGB26_04945 [Desulfobulbaceae bacterium]|nr:hypothetical protein [Desulfobulbaceae bacterium]